MSCLHDMTFSHETSHQLQLTMCARDKNGHWWFDPGDLKKLHCWKA